MKVVLPVMNFPVIWKVLYPDLICWKMKGFDMVIDQQQIFDYLYSLRDSGVTNMFGAGQYLQRDFGLDRHEARQWLTKWMLDCSKNGQS